MKKFAAGLSDAQMKLARRFQEAGLTTISQAVKAFEKRDNTSIDQWKLQLRNHDATNGREWKQ